VITIHTVGGAVGQAFSAGSLDALYVSRFISGMGIGVTTVLPSVYISEVNSIILRQFTLQLC
jgi:MFS family permease